MAERKIFAGPRLRRMRVERGLTQTAMAEGLGISPSYLNLIERNQRPLTVQLVLKLAAVYKVELQEFQAKSAASLAALREVFADPLLVGALPGETELAEIVESAPNIADAVVKLFRAYREQGARLSDLSMLLADGGRTIASARLPIDEVRDALEGRPNHFASLEEESRAFLALLQPADGLLPALNAWLKQEHSIIVRVLPAAAMPNWRRRYDRHTRRLFISERLSPFDQLREIAIEASQLRMAVAIEKEIEALRLSSAEARRIARFELGRYAANALMMPYEAFLSAAARERYDLDVLAARFGVSFEQAATRLTSLHHEGASAIPFFLVEIDRSGHRVRRMGAEGFPSASFGSVCPKAPLYASFSEPGQILAEAMEMPDGAAFLCVSRTVEGPLAAFGERVRRTAVMIGCDMEYSGAIVYGDLLPSPPAASSKARQPRTVKAGPGCRLCERVGCVSRIEPPVTRPLGLDEMVAGLSAFDFQ